MPIWCENKQYTVHSFQFKKVLFEKLRNEQIRAKGYHATFNKVEMIFLHVKAKYELAKKGRNSKCNAFI